MLPTTASFGKFRVLLGNGATPEVFAAPCGFTSKSFSLSKDLADVLLPDCTDPDLIAWVGREAISRSASVSGDGVLASESITTWLDAFDDNESINAKIEIEFPAQTVTWTAAFQIDSFEVTGTLGEKSTVAISMQSDGAVTRVVT